MSVTEYTTGIHSVLEVPLVELAHPKNLPSVLEFIAKLAPPCIAEALITKIIADLILISGCTRKAAICLINRMIQVYG